MTSSPLIERLAEQCEQATGPDRTIDRLIAVASGEYIEDKLRRPGQIAQATQPHIFGYSWPTYTASIDAAMTLVTEGWSVDNLGQQASGQWWASLLRPVEGDEDTGTVTRHSATASSFEAETPALALCAAALRAKATSND